MKKLKKVYGPQGFEILGIASDQPETLKAYYAKKGELPWLNIVDVDDAISKKFGIDVFPTYYLIDKTGKHIATPWDKNEIGALVAKALGVEEVPLKD